MSNDFYASSERRFHEPDQTFPPLKEETPVHTADKRLLRLRERGCQEELKLSGVADHAMGSEVVHSGGCHCRRVRWQVEAPTSVAAWICNCSDCHMRGNTHFVVPAARFKMQAGSEEFLTTYTFGTHTAKHTFCKVCGITSFYTPRSDPDGVAITVACVDSGTLEHVEYRHADGRNWEAWFARQREHRQNSDEVAAAAQ